MNDALKASRRNARTHEIELYGKTICWCRVEKSEKIYTRKTKHKNFRYND